MSLGQSIRSSVKWLLVGTLGGRLMTFLFGIALARLLVPDDFGVLATIRVFTGFAGMLMNAGMGQSLIRSKQASERDFNSVFTMQFGVGVMVYLFFYLAAPKIAAFFQRDLYTSLIRVSTVVFLLRPLVNIRIALLSRRMEFKKRSIANLVAGGVSNVCAVAMAWFGFGVWSLVYSGLIHAFVNFFVLVRYFPMNLRLVVDPSAFRKHSSYGVKITINDFLSYLTRESRNLILSKLAGASFLGLFNKAESLAKLPNELFMSATMQPVFRGLSKVQDDLDKTRYMIYRVITLLMVYTIPFYVILWWIAGPFIEVVYGPKWVPVIQPLRILVVSGFFFNILFPCARLLDARNLLSQEMVVLVLRLIVVTAGCVVGLRWGLQGVACGVVLSHVFASTALYLLVGRAIRTGAAALARAVAPGLVLNGMLFAFLAGVDFVLRHYGVGSEAAYLLVMALSGALFYVAIFLAVPMAGTEGETARWRSRISGGMRLAFRTMGR